MLSMIFRNFQLPESYWQLMTMIFLLSLLISTIFTNAKADSYEEAMSYEEHAIGDDYIIGGSAAKAESLPFILSYNFIVR